MRWRRVERSAICGVCVHSLRLRQFMLIMLWFRFLCFGFVVLKCHINNNYEKCYFRGTIVLQLQLWVSILFFITIVDKTLYVPPLLMFFNIINSFNLQYTILATSSITSAEQQCTSFLKCQSNSIFRPLGY